MSGSFTEFVGKVVSSFEVEGFDSGATQGAKAVKISFSDGSSIKLEFQIKMTITELGPTSFLNFENEIHIKGGGMHLE